MTKFQKLEH